ncbi:MAG: hypothetical protein OQJ89_08965 [Kangiellaceae bacterium]|nr:hypothetical protein [Kangiellaceae bacterium]MCW8998486.1 hypothetical protein [Kangiellaceae bacterium]MCW9017081.1 hypothetical protein [Kangiellaceae bacterium]
MIIFREITSFLLFLTGIALIAALDENTNTLVQIIAVAACFIIAYLIWPSKRKGKRSNDNYFWDWFELILELPFQILRGILRIFD